MRLCILHFFLLERMLEILVKCQRHNACATDKLQIKRRTDGARTAASKRHPPPAGSPPHAAWHARAAASLPQHSPPRAVVSTILSAQPREGRAHGEHARATFKHRYGFCLTTQSMTHCCQGAAQRRGSVSI